MHKSLSATCIAVLAAALSPAAPAQSTSSFSAELQAKYRVIPNVTYLTAENYRSSSTSTNLATPPLRNLR